MRRGTCMGFLYSLVVNLFSKSVYSLSVSLDNINNIVYIKSHEWQRAKTVAGAARCDLRCDERLAPQGLSKWQAVHHSDAQHRP